MRYKDRTGKEVCANGQQDVFLQKLYGTALGRKLLSVLVQPVVSRIAGRFMDSRLVCCIGFPHLFRKIISTCHNMKNRNLPVIMISLHGRSVRAADRLQRRQRRLQHRVTVSFRCIRSQRRRSFASKIHSIRWKV